MKWRLAKRCHVNDDDEPLDGFPVRYVVYNEKDEEVCTVDDLKTAMRIIAGEDFIDKMERLTDPKLTDKEETAILDDARIILHDLEHAHE